MYLKEILEVAIGLVFMWLVISIASMTIQEWIGNLFNSRAKDLEKTVREMLNSPDLAQQFYEHPLIASLYHPAKNGKKKPRLPSYLPPAKFAAALFDLVTEAGTDASPIQAVTGKVDEQLAASMDDPTQLKLALDDWKTIVDTGKQVAASGAGQAAVDTLKAQVQAYGRKYPEIQPTLDEALPQAYSFYQDFFQEERKNTSAGAVVDLEMRQFRLGLKMIGAANPKLKDTLTVLLRNAQVKTLQGDAAIARAHNQFEAWFNDAMGRLSGTYKRKAQLIAFTIGFLLALLLNVDSINLANGLWREPTLREAFIAEATAYAQSNPPVVASASPAGSTATTASPTEAITSLQNELKALNFPFGWTDTPVELSSVGTCDPFSAAAFSPAGKQTHALGLHIGTTCVPLVNAMPLTVDNVAGWLTKLLGLLITGAAAAQGAPFWFDVLQKFINVRGTGVKPADTAAVG